MKIRFAVLSTALTILVFLVTVVQAEHFATISTDELLAVREKNSGLVLINALSPVEHSLEAISGSINIPASHMRSDHPLLPADKATLLVFYCKGLRCTKSRRAAKLAMEFGYTNVKIYTPGLPGWKKRGLPVVHSVSYPDIDPPALGPLEVYQSRETALLLDVRGDEVSQVGEISSAMKIALDDLDKQYETLPHDKRIIIIDHAGKQATISARYLYKMGYHDVAVLEGGMIGWVRAGLPVE